MSQVTNADIMEKLGGIDARLIAVQAQAEKTNGRVNTIENWKNALEAVDRYKEKNPTQTIAHADNVTIQKRWYDSKDLVKAVGILAAAAGAAATYFTATGVLKP